MAVPSPPTSPFPSSRSSVPYRLTQGLDPASESYPLLQRLDDEHHHHHYYHYHHHERREQPSPTNIHERFESSYAHEADATNNERSSPESRPDRTQHTNQQNQLAAVKHCKFCKRSENGHYCWRHYIRKLWLWEFAACILSFACFSSIVVVLLCEHNKTLDTWDLFVPPTATISFIGTLAKASLVLVISSILSQMKWLHFQDVQLLDHLKTIDSGSRGPLGSVMVLRKSKKLLVSVAACLMILTILIDPFVQLVFTFPARLVADPGQSVVFERMRQFGILTPIKGGASPAMWYALNQGFAGVNVTRDIGCPSGNCSWSEPVTSLGVCGSCSKANVTKTCLPTTSYALKDGVDVTTCFYTFDDIVLSTKSGSPQPLTVASHNYRWSEESAKDRWGTLWNATSYITRARVDKSPPYTMTEPFKATIDLYEGRVPTQRTLYYADDGGIVEFAAVQVLSDGSQFDPPARCWTCKLNWCEKTFGELRVINDQFISTVSEKSLWGFSSFKNDNQEDSQKYGVLPEDINKSRKLLSTKYYSYDFQFLWLLDIFKSYYLDSLNDDMVFPSFDGTNLVNNTGMLTSLAYASDLNATISQIAGWLSEVVRTSNDPSNYHEEVKGDVQRVRSFIEVRWEWLALPVAVLTMTTVLFIIVARRSYSSGISIWKDDPTALLFHHIADLDINTGDDCIIGPEDLARLRTETYVKLSSDGALAFIKSARKLKRK